VSKMEELGVKVHCGTAGAKVNIGTAGIKDSDSTSTVSGLHFTNEGSDDLPNANDRCFFWYQASR
jgi:hypothetical protein